MVTTKRNPSIDFVDIKISRSTRELIKNNRRGIERMDDVIIRWATRAGVKTK